MVKKDLYTSKLSFERNRYDLTKLQTELLEYLKINAEQVFALNPKTKIADLYGFNSDGIKIHIQSIYSKDLKTFNYIDLNLVSEITQTIQLEDKIKELAKKHNTVD